MNNMTIAADKFASIEGASNVTRFINNYTVNRLYLAAQDLNGWVYVSAEHLNEYGTLYQCWEGYTFLDRLPLDVRLEFIKDNKNLILYKED